MKKQKVEDLDIGDVVIAKTHLDKEGANVRPGTIGIVFAKKNHYGDNCGPMVRWMNLGVCNVYEGDCELLPY